MSSSDSYSESDDEQVPVSRQPSAKQPFQVQEQEFPAFGGPSVAPASTAMDFGSAWASSQAPVSMPEVVSTRRRPKAQQAPAEPSNSQASVEAPNGIPWRSSDWDKGPGVKWSGGAPVGFRGALEDPYAETFAGRPRAPVARAEASVKTASAPAEEKKVRQPRQPTAKPQQDNDGFTQVAMRKQSSGTEQSSEAPRSLETSSAFDVLQNQESNSPKPQKPKPAPQQQGKQGNKQSKQQAKQSKQQPAKQQPAKEQPAKQQPAKEPELVFNKRNTNKPKSKSETKKKSNKKQSAAPVQSASDTNRGLFFGALLALQYGMQPLLTKECIGADVNKSSVVVVQEVSKFAIAFSLMFMESGVKGFKQAFFGVPGTLPWTLKSSVMVALIPAAIYAIQNWCLFYAAANMDPLAFNLVNQTKLIWTALFVYIVLQKAQSKMQVFAISLLMLAAFVLTTGPADDNSSTPTSFWHGIVPNLVAALLSGMAASLSQYALQGPLNRSSYVFTMELCVFQLAWFVLKEQGAMFTGTHFFDGWSTYTILPILNNALGGIFTGQVVKYAGAVRKTFAVIAALLLTSVFRFMYYENAPLSKAMYIALPLMLLGNYLHAMYPPAKK